MVGVSFFVSCCRCCCFYRISSWSFAKQHLGIVSLFLLCVLRPTPYVFTKCSNRQPSRDCRWCVARCCHPSAVSFSDEATVQSTPDNYNEHSIVSICPTSIFDDFFVVTAFQKSQYNLGRHVELVRNHDEKTKSFLFFLASFILCIDLQAKRAVLLPYGGRLHAPVDRYVPQDKRAAHGRRVISRGGHRGYAGAVLRVNSLIPLFFKKWACLDHGAELECVIFVCFLRRLFGCDAMVRRGLALESKAFWSVATHCCLSQVRFVLG